MARVMEQPCGEILKVLSHPDGARFYRSQNPPFGAVEWYTTEKEALESGLGYWQFELGTYKRNCQGQRIAANMVRLFVEARGQ